MRVLLVLLGVVVAMVVLGAVIAALKFLLFLGAVVFVVALVGGWSRRRAVAAGRRRSLR